VVPDGHVFTMGDEREASLDSRHLGFIPRERLTGRARWIYFSRESLTGEVRWHRIGSEIR
jgi:signal peptidase I